MGEAVDTILIRPNASESQDADIYFAYDNSTTNLGNWGNMNGGQRPCSSAGAYDKNTIYRTLIRFDVASYVSPSSEIVSADLILTPQGWYTKTGEPDVTLYAYQLLKTWKEGTGSAGCTEAPSENNSESVDGVTGRDRYWTEDASAEWNEIGVALDDKDAVSTKASSVTLSYGSLNAVDFSITELVSSWVKDATTNKGLLIRNKDEFSGPSGDTYQSYPRFYSGEAEKASNRPLLRIIIKK